MLSDWRWLGMFCSMTMVEVRGFVHSGFFFWFYFGVDGGCLWVVNCFGYDFKVGVLANNGMVLAKSTKENSLYIYI